MSAPSASLQDARWTMDSWLKPYVPLLRNTGGPTVVGDALAVEWVEEMMNDNATTWNNAIRASLCIAVESQIALLCVLRRKGLLNHVASGTDASSSGVSS